VLATALCGLR